MKLSKLLLSIILPTLSGATAAQSVTEHLDPITIKELKKAGSDQSKPQDVDFYLYFPSEAQATAAANEMSKLGYKNIEVSLSEGSSEWLVFATRLMLFQVESMKATTRSLQELAARHGGDYDGWETAVDP